MKHRSFNLSVFLGKYWLAILTVATFAVFSVIEPKFFSWNNFMVILCQASITCVIAIGNTFIMAAGELDFSSGTQCAAATVIMGLLLKQANFKSYIGAVIITLAFMALFGCFNAFVHITLGLPAFIATFGTSYLLQGIFRVITGDRMYNNLQAWPDSFTFLGQGYLFGVIPVLVVVLIVLSIIAALYTERTRWGRYLYALGSNPTACDYLGINARVQKLRGFILCSLFSAMAGIMQGSMANMASINVGSSTMMTAITVIFVGATFLKNGVFNVPGTIIASFLLSMLDNGLTMAGSGAWFRDFIQGVMLLGSLVLVMVFRQRAMQVKRVKTVNSARGGNGPAPISAPSDQNT